MRRSFRRSISERHLPQHGPRCHASGAKQRSSHQSPCGRRNHGERRALLATATSCRCRSPSSGPYVAGIGRTDRTRAVHAGSPTSRVRSGGPRSQRPNADLLRNWPKGARLGGRVSDSYTRLTDDERELVIDTLTVLAQSSADGVRRYWWDRLREQIAARSPEQVEKIERARGLRAA